MIVRNDVIIIFYGRIDVVSFETIIVIVTYNLRKWVKTLKVDIH